MVRAIEPKLSINGLQSIGTYRFQLSPGEEAVFQLYPTPNRVIFILKDMKEDAKPRLKIKTESNDLFLSFEGLGKIMKWGTTKTSRIGTYREGKENVEIWHSFSVSTAKESVMFDVALYLKISQEESDGSAESKD